MLVSFCPNVAVHLRVKSFARKSDGTQIKGLFREFQNCLKLWTTTLRAKLLCAPYCICKRHPSCPPISKEIFILEEFFQFLWVFSSRAWLRGKLWDGSTWTGCCPLWRETVWCSRWEESIRDLAPFLERLHRQASKSAKKDLFLILYD